MQDYSNFPPIKYFSRVLKVCPKSAQIYLQIWQNKDKNMEFILDKKNIRRDFHISPTIFRNLLAPLMIMNLIDAQEGHDKFQIDIFGPNLNE